MKHDFLIKDFGAVPGGETLCTEAIQAAIAACHENGGGRVLVGPGTWLTGTIDLLSHVELHLTAGSTLLGSTNLADYPEFSMKGFHVERAPERSSQSLIRAAFQKQIAVTGRGTIDGQGLAFYEPPKEEGGNYHKPATPRPRMIMFYECEDILIEGVSLLDCSCWTVWLMQSKRIQVNRIQIRGDFRILNNDGIDVDACQQVTISDSLFQTSDDCVILRAIQQLYDREAICEHVTVSNCVLESKCQGIRVGCPSDHIVRDATFSNLVIRGPAYGITIENPKRYYHEDAPTTLALSNVLFHNIVIDTARAPIRVTVEEGITLAGLSNLNFSQIRARSNHGITLLGNSTTSLRNIVLDGVHLETKAAEPLVVKHCHNLQLRNFQVDCVESDS